MGKNQNVTKTSELKEDIIKVDTLEKAYKSLNSCCAPYIEIHVQGFSDEKDIFDISFLNYRLRDLIEEQLKASKEKFSEKYSIKL